MTVWLGVAAGAVVLVAWYFWRRETYVPCTLDVESTHEHLHAILELNGFDPEPGDGVRMENAPQEMSSVALGHRSHHESRAVVRRASWLKRRWVRIVGNLEFKELFEVGFE